MEVALAETFKNKDAGELLTLEQVQILPEYAGILGPETILVDVDDREQSKYPVEHGGSPEAEMPGVSHQPGQALPV